MTHLLDRRLFGHESFGEILLFRDLHRRLTFALLVLKIAIEQHYARLLDMPTHLRVRDVLVQNDAHQ